MELAGKGDLLSNLIKKAKTNERIIEEKEIWRICRTVGQGLKMLHAKNIVHKDIKPQNILMMDDSSVKVSQDNHLFCSSILIWLSAWVDCGYGYISVSCQLRVQECVSQQSGHAPLHKPRSPQETALRLQSWYLGPWMSPLLHDLLTATVLSLERRAPSSQAKQD